MRRVVYVYAYTTLREHRWMNAQERKHTHEIHQSQGKGSERTDGRMLQRLQRLSVNATRLSADDVLLKLLTSGFSTARQRGPGSWPWPQRTVQASPSDWDPEHALRCVWFGRFGVLATTSIPGPSPLAYQIQAGQAPRRRNKQLVSLPSRVRAHCTRPAG